MVGCLQGELTIGIGHGVLVVLAITDDGTDDRFTSFIHHHTLQSSIRALPLLVRHIAALHDDDVLALAHSLERTILDDGLHCLLGSLATHVDRHLEVDVIVIVLNLLARLLFHFVQGRRSLFVDKRHGDSLGSLRQHRRSHSKHHRECHAPSFHVV